jgi:hypothetical protein
VNNLAVRFERHQLSMNLEPIPNRPGLTGPAENVHGAHVMPFGCTVCSTWRPRVAQGLYSEPVEWQEGCMMHPNQTLDSQSRLSAEPVISSNGAIVIELGHRLPDASRLSYPQARVTCLCDSCLGVPMRTQGDLRPRAARPVGVTAQQKMHESGAVVGGKGAMLREWLRLYGSRSPVRGAANRTIGKPTASGRGGGERRCTSRCFN